MHLLLELLSQSRLTFLFFDFPLNVVACEVFGYGLKNWFYYKVIREIIMKIVQETIYKWATTQEGYIEQLST